MKRRAEKSRVLWKGAAPLRPLLAPLASLKAELRYCDAVVERWEKFMGRKAKRTKS